MLKYGTRYYMPNLMRWTQPDPVKGNPANPMTLNGYAYVGCDPINATDPTGRAVADGCQGLRDLQSETFWPAWAIGGLNILLGYKPLGVGLWYSSGFLQLNIQTCESLGADQYQQFLWTAMSGGT